ncbi:phosphatase PAP2 family protein [Halalkalibacter alkaliphilus]|uniref:Phosphatase PAP2 family protein n=1 Tax=Halalkalibacter alkaliphilus TaxID=2917993 RepID=A0A9X1ZXQ7_9BACI|nr:phosphatase PAP2 family protein [Halalkalibacter alkaliphilus]MCL7746628.1 phosphatase PAP2 family protein [Halalkalibacter alkaliphilus]
MADSNKHQFFIATGCLILFIFISILSYRDQLVFFDQTIISWVTEGASPLLISFMEGITKIGSGEVILVTSFAIGFYLLVRKMWGYALFLFTVTFGGIALNFLLKILFQRERPGEMSVIEVFGYSLEIASYSFPSGHTMRSFIFFSFLIYICVHIIRGSFAKVSFTLLFISMIVLVSLSRVIVGAHFPSDILAAGTISIAWFYFCLLFLRFLLKGRISYT